MYTTTVNFKVFGMTPEGLVIPDFEDCRLEIIKEWRTVWGNEVPIDGDTKTGQKITLEAEREHGHWLLMQAYHASMDPDQAEDSFLDARMRLIGINRKRATKTQVTGKFLGQDGTIVPIGAICSTIGGDQFYLIEEVTIQSGEVTGIFNAIEFGPIDCLAGDLTQIETGELGWDSITNDLDAVKGRLKESNSEARSRRNDTVNSGGAGRVDMIKEKVFDLTGVSRVEIFENDTKYIDERGQEANTLEIFVSGGDANEIVQVMWDFRPGASPYIGNTFADIIDSRGVTRTIWFTRPTEIQLWIIVDVVEKEAEFSANETAQILQFILDKKENIGIGKKVIVEYLKGSYSDVPYLIKSNFFIGTSADPTASDDIEIEETEYSSIDSSRIIINIL